MRRRRSRRRGVDPLDLRVVRPAEAPGGDHERRDEQDRGQGDADGVRLAALAAPAAGRRRCARQARGAASALVPGDVAGVVLVDVEPPVEAERIRVDAEKALRVRVPRELVEPLVLQVPEVLGAHLRARLQLLEVEVLADARLAQARADLEHERRSVVASRKDGAQTTM